MGSIFNTIQHFLLMTVSINYAKSTRLGYGVGI
jgi:hypothetical protein